ncbi:unnamed protein product [Ilex paraguariensis]|uniref:TF-B3 domain-containing protein n=1 Tax=Ilex paraguariensis TaxID=185542 RepID=A0ABC8RYJ9_9AQUA
MLQQPENHYQELDRHDHNLQYNGNNPRRNAKGFFTWRTRRELLFEKVITRSDINQNRLAIPKYHAKQHFPLNLTGNSKSKGALIFMEDDEGRVWRFRYTFWKSCQAYVLTSEWNHFVKEKGLHAGDVISVLRSCCPYMKLHIELKPQGNSDIMAKPESFEPVQHTRMVKLFGVDISTSLSK